MGKRIGTVSSATLNVIWTPVRHGVRWAETPEEIPRWDITLDGSQHIHPRMSYQDFLALDSAAQQLEVEELPYTVYGKKITLKGVRPPRVHEIDAPRWENAYPRLVIRWPGLDMDALHLPRSAEFDKFGVLPKWTARGSVWKAIRNLFPSARVKHKQEQFKAAIIEVVHRFSLLFPDKGDTLQNWYDAVLEVEYISRLLKKSFRISREESARKKINGSELLHEEALKLARELSRDNKYALRARMDCGVSRPMK